MNTFAESILQFYRSLSPDFPLPKGVAIMNPYKESKALASTTSFYTRYFNDNKERIYIFGINPGRFGGGITGIPFTDPLRLKNNCSIEHQFPLKPELSSEFIYLMIEEMGGPEKFYSTFFLTAVCPLGFTQSGKNLNYYDSKQLFTDAKGFIYNSMKNQLKAGCRRDIAYCIGEGTNHKHFEILNKDLKLFKTIIPLPHPRWIMQYRRSTSADYIKIYKESLNASGFAGF